MIEKLNENNKKEWKNKVDKLEYCPIQTNLNFKEVIERTYSNCKENYFIGQECLYPFFLVKSKIFGKRFISLPFLDVGGFFGNPSEKDVLEIIEKAKEGKVKNIQVRTNKFMNNFESTEKILSKLGFKKNVEKHQFIIHLTSEEDIWKRFHKHTRNDIRKAEKSGLNVVGIKDEDEMKKFYNLYLDEMKKFGTPQHSYKFFKNLLYFLKEDFFGLNCYFKDRLIGSIIILRNKNYSNIAFNVSDEKYRGEFRPNDFLYWESIKWAVKNNVKFVDMGQVEKDAEEGSHAQGLYKFKSKWLGELYERIYFTFSFKDEKSSQKKDSLKKYRKIWKKLPLSLVKIIGPKICRELGI